MSFLDVTPKARVRKAKTSKRDYIKIKSFYTEKETMVMGVHQPYCSDHFIIYTRTESLWCISETNSVVCQLYLKNTETTIWKSSTYDHWFSLSWRFSSAQFSHSVVSKSATPWVHHQLLESTQTHVHWVTDAIQPSHPLSSPSPALNLSQHQGLFKWVSSSNEVAKVLEFQLQHQSFQWTPRTDLL